MKRLIMFITLALIFVVSSADNGNCIWKYKCCSYQETNGKRTCARMCEPEIDCGASEASKDYEAETFKETEGGPDAAEYFLRGRTCRRGYKIHDGRCRRVFGNSQL